MHRLLQERKVQQIGREKDRRHVSGTSERIWICQRGGEKEDIFIPESETNGAMHMDTVEISVSPAVTGRRREGKVLHVLERGMKQVVCTYQLNKNFGFAVPDNPKFGSDIFIPLERSKGAVNGHKVVVEITQYGKRERIRKEKWWRS